MKVKDNAPLISAPDNPRYVYTSSPYSVVTVLGLKNCLIFSFRDRYTDIQHLIYNHDLGVISFSILITLLSTRIHTVYSLNF